MSKPQNEAVSELIGRLAVRALLREAAAAPKPGLVDRFGSGSHDDMDFMTFADSALALSPSFVALAHEGYIRGTETPAWIENANSAATGARRNKDGADRAFLSELRSIGMKGEKHMFHATGGVNTHKGALFLLGLQAAAAGALLGAGHRPNADLIRRFSSRIVRGISETELRESETNGARAFRSFGSRGVRGEAESGLSSLDGGALHALRKAARAGRIGDCDCIDALLMIMRVCDDTTIIHRGGIDALELVRTGAARILSLGGFRTDEGRAELRRFSRTLESARLSPGGSADILAAGLFLIGIETSFAAARRRNADERSAHRQSPCLTA